MKYYIILFSDVTGEYKPTAVEKKNPMLCDAAQSVLAMGYLPRIVKRAVDQILQNEGTYTAVLRFNISFTLIQLPHRASST